MSQNKYIGGLEESVLIAVHALGSDAYGVSIHNKLHDVNRRLSIGSLYVTLGRLEEKGYISSMEGEATEERGGRAKRYFKLTGNGIRALSDAEMVRAGLLDGYGGLVPWKA